MDLFDRTESHENQRKRNVMDVRRKRRFSNRHTPEAEHAVSEPSWNSGEIAVFK